MKLSKETREILQNFAQINPQIKIDAGSLLMTKSINNTVYAESEIKETFTEEWCIYSLSAFLRVLSLIGEDAEITSDGEVLTIAGNGTEVTYHLSDSSIIAYPAKRPQLPAANVIFELTNDQLSQITKASQALGLDTLSITTKNGKLILKAFETKSKNSNAFAIEIQDYDGDNKFDFQLDIKTMNFMKSDYIVQIAAAGAIRFESKDQEDKHSYILALQETSSHDFEL